MTQYRLIIASDPDDLARQCAERIASCIDLALAERDRAQIALAGGETPKPAYERLGREHLPWGRVDVLLGDPGKARQRLGWEADIKLPALVAEMIEADLARHRARMR